MKVLLISEATLKKYSLLSENIDGQYILPAIQSTQDIDLDTMIGPVLNSKLQELVQSNAIRQPINAAYKTLLDDYVTPYMVWQVMSTIQIAINYKFSNSGMIQQSDERKTALSYNDNQRLQQQYQHYADSYANKMKNYLCKNANRYPEYKQSENFEYEEDPQLCNIFLGDVRNRHNYIGK